MKKFIIYFLIHAFGLVVISFIFWHILQKDVPDNKPIELTYQNENIRISRNNTGIPSIETADPTTFAFGVGFLWSQDRLLHLHLWKNLCSGNTAYTLSNDSLIKSDVFIKSLKIDSLAGIIYNNLDNNTKNYLSAVTAGFNSGMQLRKINDEIPFLFDKLKIESAEWKPENFISLMIAQTIITGIHQNIYENILLNSESLPDRHKELFKYFISAKIRQLPNFAGTLFIPLGGPDSTNTKFMVFENNILPSLSYPVQWIKSSNIYNTLFSAGTPFPYFVNGKSASKSIDYSRSFY
ncbi:MAG: penicillin acylase family protein, partial [Calditrichia bacterium]|nr:penicillin acylase family protein [Calditrichia bacterium]